jgi:peptide/nickel transport system substrate-binding protein
MRRATNGFSGLALNALLTALALAALVACTRKEEGQQDQAAAKGATEAGNRLVFLVPSEPPSLDAHREITFATIHPTAPHYSLLVMIDPEHPSSGRVVGDLAESWTVSPDGKTFTFTLHPGVTFHDGSPLTSRDVVASLNKIIFPPEGVVSPRKAYYPMVESIAAPDPRTVVIRLSFASPAFLPALALPFNYIYSADKLAADMRWYEKNVMGSGPFVFKEYVPGAYWKGERYAGYFKPGLPKLDGFEAIFAPKESVRLQALRGGRAMIEFRGFSPQGRDDLVRALDGQIRVQESLWNCGIYVVPNPAKKPFDDVRVRRALSLALDRWEGSQYLSKIAIVKEVGGVVFPGDPLAMERAELAQLPGYGRDIAAARAEARRLLKAAGVPEGFKFRLHNRAVDQPYKIAGTWVIDQWRQIGLDVEQWVQQDGPFFETLTASQPEFETSIDFNCGAVVNPTLDVSKFISADKSDSNYARYIDRELDRLFDAQLRETDPAKQEALLHQFERRLLGDQVHYIMLFWFHRIIPHSTKVKGWTISPSHYLNQDLSTVWVE